MRSKSRCDSSRVSGHVQRSLVGLDWHDAADPTHLGLLQNIDDTPRNGKTLLRRATGRFYTHEVIGRHLAKLAGAHLAGRQSADPVRAIDPFAGDGRLLAWMLEELALSSTIRAFIAHVWDSDEVAIEMAVQRLESTASRLGVHVEVVPFVGDSFTRAQDEAPSFDVVLTNPPWELLKPDSREMALMPADIADSYVRELRRLDRSLGRAFPHSQPSSKFAGWGTNLARVGTEVAVGLTGPGGICGVVSPSSLFADSTSDELRRWIFENLAVTDVAYFPAEAKLFDAVDVPCLVFLGQRVATSGSPAMSLVRYDAARRILDQGAVVLSPKWLQDLGYVLPVSLGAAGIALLEGLSDHPFLNSLGERFGMWAGRELDETRRQRYLANAGIHPFVKGGNVRRFGMLREPQEYVNPAKIALPASTRHPRLVWRDVSRPNQKRRVQATLIPAGWVTGNSLGVAYLQGDDLLRLAALLAVFSSVPFEYQLRSILSTGHISLTSVRRVRVPNLEECLVNKLGALTIAALDGRPGSEIDVEVAAARAYGLDRPAWESMLRAFPKLTESEVHAHLSAWDAC